MPTPTRTLPAKPLPIPDPATDPKDLKIPATLLAIGILIYLVYAFITGGTRGLAAMATLLPVRLAVQVALGCIACLLTAKIMGTAFGYVSTACVKLAAVFIFPTAVTCFIPYVGWIIALLLYWGLLEWLFELEATETIIFSVVIFLINAAAILLVATIGFGMGR